VQAATESEEFDLAGFDQPKVEELVQLAFTTPIKTPEPLRLTFVVGGGKKVRQKYYEAMSLDFGNALRSSAGYVENAAAAVSRTCQGVYKFQHDTDKDLKFLHVFPRIDSSAPQEANADDDEEEDIRIGGMRIDDLPPAHVCGVCDLGTFNQIVGRQVPSFAQKRALLKAMNELQSFLTEHEKAAQSGQPTAPNDQDLYDNVQDIDAKLTWLKEQMDTMIEKGYLSKGEISEMLEEWAEKAEKLEEHIEKAKADGKKTTKLEEQAKILDAKVARLKEIPPWKRPVKNAKEITQIKRKLAELDKIENAKGLQSLETLKKLNAKPELEKQLKKLEGENDGWFMDAVKD
jgi:hypothetical protein